MQANRPAFLSRAACVLRAPGSEARPPPHHSVSPGVSLSSSVCIASARQRGAPSTTSQRFSRRFSIEQRAYCSNDASSKQELDRMKYTYMEPWASIGGGWGWGGEMSSPLFLPIKCETHLEFAVVRLSTLFLLSLLLFLVRKRAWLPG